MRKTIISLLLAIFAATSFMAAKTGSIVRNITMTDGLKSNTVRNIVEDKYGFIWFGTDNGLCRFDGLQTTAFEIPDNGIDQFIVALQSIEEGIIAGTSNGAYLLSFDTEKFTKIALDENKLISDIATDKEGNVWMTTSKNVYKYKLQLRK